LNGRAFEALEAILVDAVGLESSARWFSRTWISGLRI
jgi:hypothetical protein